MKPSALTRPVYRHAELDRVLNPKNVCIVGASPKVGSFGDRVLANLAGFDGNVYLVNSRHEKIGGLPLHCLRVRGHGAPARTAPRSSAAAPS